MQLEVGQKVSIFVSIKQHYCRCWSYDQQQIMTINKKIIAKTLLFLFILGVIAVVINHIAYLYVNEKITLPDFIVDRFDETYYIKVFGRGLYYELECTVIKGKGESEKYKFSEFYYKSLLFKADALKIKLVNKHWERSKIRLEIWKNHKLYNSYDVEETIEVEIN